MKEDIEIYITTGLALGSTSGVITGLISYFLTGNPFSIALGLSTWVAIGLSLSIAIFYLRKKKKWKNIKRVCSLLVFLLFHY